MLDPGGSSLRLAAGEDICPVPGGPESECLANVGRWLFQVDIVQTGFEYSVFFFEVRIGGKFRFKG